MDSFTKRFQRNNEDPTIRGLIEVSQVSDSIAKGDDAALRRIAAVVGGDAKEGDLLVRRTKGFLDKLRSAINRVVLHSGFSSSGSLTDALNHPGFIELTNSLENGLILEQLALYEDPTGVLAGAQMIIQSALDQLKYTYSSESMESIMSRAHNKEGSLMQDIADKARYNTVMRGARMSVSSTIGTVGTNPAQVDDDSCINRVASALDTGRTLITGPRRILKNVVAGSGTTLSYSSHFEGVMAGAPGANIKAVVARFALVGLPSDVTGSVRYNDEVAADQVGSRDTILVSQPSDIAIAGLFHTPRTVAAAFGARTEWYGETNGAGTYLGFANNSILIPLSGLEDMTVGANGLGGMSGDIRSNPRGADVDALVNGRKGFDGDDALESEIDVDLLIDMAGMAGLGGNQFDVAVFDVVAIMAYTHQLTGNPGAYECVYNFAVNTQVDRESLPRSATSIIRSRTNDASVAMVREFYDDSEHVKRAKAYQRHCTIEGRNDPTSTLFREMLSEQTRKNIGVLGDAFKSINGGAVGLVNTINVVNGSVPEFASGLAASKVISDGTLDVFSKPLNSTTWIGPNRMPATMVMLNEVRKLGIFRRWMRILDYVTLESMLDLDFNQSYQLGFD
jgi:hypothetical protein